MTKPSDGALSAEDITFNIDSSTSANDSSAVHTLTSIEVGGQVYTDFIAPDSVSFEMDDLEGFNNEARLYVGSEGGSLDTSLYPTDGVRNDDFEDIILERAFQSNDLNSYLESSSPSSVGEQSYTLGYTTPITVSDEGYILITERNGNNNFTIELLDESGNVITTVNAIDKNADGGNYLDLGIATRAQQTIHAAVFRLTEIEGLEEGTLIHSVRVVMDVNIRDNGVPDAGDGKVLFFGIQEVAPPNAPPDAVNDEFEGAFNQPIDGAVLGNDSDPDGDPLSVIDNTQPASGSVVMNPDGTFTYTPEPGFSGEDSFTYTISDGNGGYDQATVHITVPCFAAGTLIVTAEGPKPVEEIRIGDKVLTRDDGFQPVRWAGSRALDAGYLARNPDFAAVLITAGALGNALPRRDLRVSPGHRILLSGYQAEMLFGEREVLVAASDLVGQPGITQESRPVTYVHIMFDSHQIIDSEGAWSESFQPADVTLNGLDTQQRDELLALFPELATQHGQRSYITARKVLARHESAALLAM